MDSHKSIEIIKDPQKALDFARAYKKEGKYEQALEMHEWFHSNVLSIRPSLFGVRLAGALVSWIRLAEVYPKARQRLIQIRNEKIIKIKNGGWKLEDFIEVRAISRELKENEIAIEIFKLICEKETDKNKVNKCFDFILECLIDKKEIELIRKYLRDPLTYVKEYIEHFRRLEGVANNERLSEVIALTGKKMYIDRMRLLVRAFKLVNLNKEAEVAYNAGKGIIPDEEYMKVLD